MSDQERSSPYGRGFVAACIVLGAILLCGGALVIADLADSPGTANAAAGSVAAGAARPATPGRVASDPSSPGPSDTPGRPGAGRSTCGVAGGDQAVPTEAPAVDGWEVSRRVVVPRSAAYGPAEVDSDGFRRCFAHSPTGALFAAYNAIAAVGDQRQAVSTATKLLLPGPDTDSLLHELREQTPPDIPGEATQLAGFRILDATRDRVTLLVAIPVQTEFVSAHLTLVWHRGDWRVVPPRPGQPFGAPFSQHRDLDDFITWRGI